jgi:succinate dehydrogenase hydrophobic anchor subunit
VLLPLLAFHLVLQVFVVGVDHINFASVSARLSVALYFAIDLLLLVSVLLHAGLGLRSIAVDYIATPKSNTRLTGLLLGILAGLILFGAAGLYAFIRT